MNSGNFRNWRHFLFACVTAFGASAQPATRDPLDSEIRSLIEAMPQDAKTQWTTINALRHIGEPGVPYVIKYLNDARSLPATTMPISPGPNTGIGMPARLVSTTMVSSALMYLLFEVTGESFDHYFYDFEVKSADELSINQWRRWCATKYPEKADVCWNSENGHPEVARPLHIQ